MRIKYDSRREPLAEINLPDQCKAGIVSVMGCFIHRKAARDANRVGSRCLEDDTHRSFLRKVGCRDE